ncbi:urease accessory UreF family protein [Streptomyces sp. HYC2]|uniref:urease accessory protein UreF n=1 Tax=Streptomyces sp. HYC2 TaxID=2955207 RepID=UPI0024805F96|nr:urease accessory UreF family protein [Streptomyces sp. HYC2]
MNVQESQESQDRQPQATPPALLLLADGRFPSGGHAHSGGLEAAAALDGVDDLPALEEFLRGRLATTGVVTAAFTAAACAVFGGTGRRATEVVEALETLDREFAARTPSPALRTASRRLGRQLLRAGRAIWPHPRLDELSAAPRHGLHQPVALGAVAAAAGLGPDAAALAAAHDAVLTPATAAVRLLGLDPFAVHATVARLGPRIAAVAAEAARHAHTAPDALPSRAGPLLDIRAEHHAAWEVRLFAS